MFGVGEAAYVNIAPAIIDDLFTSKQSKIIALTIFSIAMCIGAGLGYMLSGNVLLWTGSWQWAISCSCFVTVPVLVFYILFVDNVPHGGVSNYEYLEEEPDDSSWEDLSCNTGLYRSPSASRTRPGPSGDSAISNKKKPIKKPMTK